MRIVSFWMFTLFHHPDYVAPPPPGSPHAFDKYGLVMQALGESGASFTLETPDPMPRHWVEALTWPPLSFQASPRSGPPAAPPLPGHG